MGLLYSVIEIMACFADAIGALLFLYFICGKRKDIRKKKFFLYSFPFFYIISIISFVVDNGFISILLYVIVLLIYEKLLLAGSTGKKIYYNILWNILLMCSNFLVVYGAAALVSVDVETVFEFETVERSMLIIINKIFLFFVAVLIIVYNNNYKMEYGQWIISVMQFTGTIIIGILLMELYIKK